MADRSPYSIPAEDLPQSTDEELDSLAIRMPQPAGYAISAGMGVAGCFVGTSMGAAPWGATDPLTILSACLLVWLLTVSTGAVADGGRRTPVGMLASMLLQFGLTAGLVRVLLPAILGLVADNAALWLFIILFLVTFPVVSAPLSLRRMRETLWQDVSYSSLDGALMSCGVVRWAWRLQHLGDFRSDRYGIVETESAGKKLHFVIDKMRGMLAGVSEPKVAEKAMGMLGYAVERMTDRSHTVRTIEYSVRPWDEIQFEAPPAKGITAEDYYQRL